MNDFNQDVLYTVFLSVRLTRDFDLRDWSEDTDCIYLPD